MGMTLEFYSAQPADLIPLLVASNDERDAAALAAIPRASFSLRLYLPDDMDALCKAMIESGLDAPASFHDLRVKDVWNPDASESLALVSDRLTTSLALASDPMLASVAERWRAIVQEQPPPHTWEERSMLFLDPSTLHVDAEALPGTRQALHDALTQLRAVASDAVAHGRPLLVYLLGEWASDDAPPGERI